MHTYIHHHTYVPNIQYACTLVWNTASRKVNKIISHAENTHTYVRTRCMYMYACTVTHIQKLCKYCTSLCCFGTNHAYTHTDTHTNTHTYVYTLHDHHQVTLTSFSPMVTSLGMKSSPEKVRTMQGCRPFFMSKNGC